jgi:RNA polymerase sigma-70 factor (ECF subfamily)
VNTTPDTGLVLAARAGDARAMETLLGRHFAMVRAVCHRIAGASRDGDDATQEAMIRIVRGIDRFDGRSSFSTWAYRIASNSALDELRRRGRRPALHLVDDGERPDPVDELAERTVTASGDREAVQQALQQLPEDFRIPVVLRDVADLDYDEIAESLGIPIGTVKSRIARGRRQLVELLGNQDGSKQRPTIDPRDHP